MSKTYVMTLAQMPEDEIKAMDSLMRDLQFRSREDLLIHMVAAFRAIRERVNDKEQLGFMTTAGQFVPFDIPHMNAGYDQPPFLILAYPPDKPADERSQGSASATPSTGV